MLNNGTIIDNTYQIMNEIGSGGMGVVYLAYHIRLEKYVVLKKIKDSSANISMLRNEVDILKSLNHPFLPQVYDFIEYDYNLFTVIDYIDGNDLNYYINNGYVFDENQLNKWLIQLCDVLEYLHSRNPKILHTDIKPGNIIIRENGDICLIDFGISLYSSDEIKGLSQDYSSPEQYETFLYLLNGSGIYRQIDERTDIYSLGATFYHLITGIKPNIQNYVQLTFSDQYSGYSEAFLSILDKTVAWNVEERYTDATALKKALNNVYKYDKQYKKYVLFSIITSLISGVLILSGIIMIISGVNENIQIDFENDYNLFIHSYNIGDNNQAREIGRKIISVDSYSSYLTKERKALVLHTLGDSYFYEDDYSNSLYYYEMAVQEPININDRVNYCKDYVIAGIYSSDDNSVNNGINILKQISPESPVLLLIEAQEGYHNSDFQNALKKALSIENSLKDDKENAYSLYMLIGNCYEGLYEFNNSTTYFNKAKQLNENITSLRKLGDSALKYYAKNNSSAHLAISKNAFEKICNDYKYNDDDIINLTQIYLLTNDTGHLEYCKKLIQNRLNESEDCRLYIMMAIFCDRTSDTNAKDYCFKAHKSYIKNKGADIDVSFFDEIKRLYQKYYNQVW